MKAMLKRLFLTLTVFSFVALLTACVDEDVAVNGQNQGDVADGDHDGDGDGDPGPVECADGEVINPMTGQCVPDDSEIPIEPDDGDEEYEDGDDDGDGDDEIPTNCGFGSILGQVCNTGGNPLPAADVQLVGVDCYGEHFSKTTTTDGNGMFEFNSVPAGHHELLVTSGSFAQERYVDVMDGQQTNLATEAEKVCVDGDVNILILPGFWDDVASLLDGLELDYTVKDTAQDAAYIFSDPAELAQYDIIFVECGFSWGGIESLGDFDQMKNNLRFWLQQGNSIYGADLTSRVFTDLYPGVATFNNDSYNGAVNAQVVSTPMQTLLGAGTIEIYFQSIVTGIASIVPEVVVHFQSPAGKPLMISYTEPIGGGTLLYMTFHNRPGTSPELVNVLEFTIFQL